MEGQPARVSNDGNAIAEIRIIIKDLSFWTCSYSSPRVLSATTFQLARESSSSHRLSMLAGRQSNWTLRSDYDPAKQVIEALEVDWLCGPGAIDLTSTARRKLVTW